MTEPRLSLGPGFFLFKELYAYKTKINTAPATMSDAATKRLFINGSLNTIPPYKTLSKILKRLIAITYVTVCSWYALFIKTLPTHVTTAKITNEKNVRALGINFFRAISAIIKNTTPKKRLTAAELKIVSELTTADLSKLIEILNKKATTSIHRAPLSGLSPNALL